jgi:LytS/YehU family sensor histidine kinase
MSVSGIFSTFLMGVIYMAIILVLVRPDSHAASVISSITNSLADLTHAAITGEPEQS